MPLVRLYFQYTHFTNSELASLRTLVSSRSGKLNLISAKSLFLQSSIAFGKILVITLSANDFQFELITAWLAAYKALRLLFINYDSFMLSPALYLSYMQHKLISATKINICCLPISINNVRILLFKTRYMLMALLVLFQEKLLYKYMSQFIC
jgi:hypothetical protein